MTVSEPFTVSIRTTFNKTKHFVTLIQLRTSIIFTAEQKSQNPQNNQTFEPLAYIKTKKILNL
ncbi:hypothetical protein Hanom_Chr08g00734301 [Helianthus anomalus]